MVRLGDVMDRLFENSWMRPGDASRAERELRLPLDVYTTPSEIVVIANVPGLKPEEVSITLENDTLSVNGEIKAPMENVDYVFQERPYGKFSRADDQRAGGKRQGRSDVRYGVLTITLPAPKPPAQDHRRKHPKSKA
jgi:HSP20 family protein